MHHLSHLRICLLLAAFVFLCPTAFSASSQIDSAYGPLPVFELHSGFWINLHHTLYDEAHHLQQLRQRKSPLLAFLPAATTT